MMDVIFHHAPSIHDVDQENSAQVHVKQKIWCEDDAFLLEIQHHISYCTLVENIFFLYRTRVFRQIGFESRDHQHEAKGVPPLLFAKDLPEQIGPIEELVRQLACLPSPEHIA